MEQLQSQSTSSSHSASAPPGFCRCRARNRSGSQCRLRAQDPANGLCSRHAARTSRATLSAPDRADLSADLFGEVVPTFQSAEEINATLAHLVVLVAQGRISSRRAAVITYALSLILRGVQVIDKKAADAPDQLEWSDSSWRPACVIHAEAARNSSAPTSNSTSNNDAKSLVANHNSPVKSHASRDTFGSALSVPQPPKYNPLFDR
jgi:hypothetical protein